MYNQEYQEYREYEDYEFAGFWIRFMAFFCDVLLILVFIYILYLFYGYDFLIKELPDLSPLITVVWTLLFDILMVAKLGGSPGKLIFGLKVVRSVSGQNVTFLQALFRHVFSTLLLNVLIGHIWIAIDDKKRAWHDLLFNTAVIRYTKKEPVRFARPVPPTPKPPKPVKRRRHHCL